MEGNISELRYHTLSCGLRCVYHPSASNVEYLGVTVNVGSREDGDYPGLAHFVEHTIFKGTSKRRSSHIINRMEACGGELNAYTTKETTVVYSVFPEGNAARAAELISDLICNSVFPERELEHEREVVADEINSYLDIPSEAVYDDFEDLIFANSSLGHNILGDADTISSITPDICRAYLGKYYVASNMVLFYSGPMSENRLCRIAERYFGKLSSASAPLNRIAPGNYDSFCVERSLGIHQAHTVTGVRVGEMFSSGRHAMALLSNILAGPGMNSLLNVQLREKRGLVYSVDSSQSLLTDTGLFSIYFGCDAEDSARCRKIISDTIDSLAQSPVTVTRLERYKRQFLGQIIVGTDNRENFVLSMARAVLYYGVAFTSSQRRETIEAITPDDIMDAARSIHPSRMSTLTFN